MYKTLASDGDLSLKKVAEKTGLSYEGVKKIFSKLQQYGILKRTVSKRDGMWLTI